MRIIKYFKLLLSFSAKSLKNGQLLIAMTDYVSAHLDFSQRNDLNIMGYHTDGTMYLVKDELISQSEFYRLNRKPIERVGNEVNRLTNVANDIAGSDAPSHMLSQQIARLYINRLLARNDNMAGMNEARLCKYMTTSRAHLVLAMISLVINT